MLRMTSLRLSAAIFAFLLLFGCAKREESRETPQMAKEAPGIYRVSFETTKGDFVVEVTREWAPRGADRFYELVGSGFYEGCRFFRVVPRFVAQFGINGDPSVSQLWSQTIIPDDPVRESNKKGTLSYAMSGPATRTTQVFINLADNTRLDSLGFAPFGRVVSGMEVVEQLFKGYGDAPPQGVGPAQERIQREGNQYLERYFPRLDYIKRAVILPA